MHWQVLVLCQLREISRNFRLIIGQRPSVFPIVFFWFVSCRNQQRFLFFFPNVLISPSCVRLEPHICSSLVGNTAVIKTPNKCNSQASVCQLTAIFIYSLSQAKHVHGVILDPGELVSVLQTQHKGVEQWCSSHGVCVATVSSLLIADIFGDGLWGEQALVHPKNGVHQDPLNLALHK